MGSNGVISGSTVTFTGCFEFMSLLVLLLYSIGALLHVH
jgi:hypothetical protein